MAKRLTITLSDELAAAVELLRKRNGRLYRTASEYFQALARYDAQTQRDHLLSAEWAAMSPYERDQFDAALLRQVKSGKGIRGSWLEARIEEAIKRLAQEGAAISVHSVAAKVARSVASQDSAGHTDS